MKKLLLPLAAVLLISLSSSTVATFHGETEKQGPEAEFTVGFASDQYAEVELEIPEREGLNVTYRENYTFRPSQVDRAVSREGDNIPVKDFDILVQSVEPSQDDYTLPVTLRATGESEDGRSTTPRVVHERQYDFRFITEDSSDYDFDGGLIDGSERKTENPAEEVDESQVNSSEENSIIEENQSIEQVEEKTEEGPDSSTLILAFGVVLVFSYVIYEAGT